MTNILFVCGANRFRSRVAEAIFRFHNRNPSLEVRSAGARISLLERYVSKNVKQIMKDRGYPTSDEPSHPFDDYLSNWADKIIIVADNIAPDQFPAAKTEVWPLPHADDTATHKISLIIDNLESRVLSLLKEMQINK